MSDSTIVRSATNDSVAIVEYGASKDFEKNCVKARNTPLGIMLRSISTLQDCALGCG